MKKVNFEMILMAEYDALQELMCRCKTVHMRYKLTCEHKEFLLRQSILSIYAGWEGFVKKAIALYLQELNKMELTCIDLHDNYISYQSDLLVKFKNPRTDFDAVIKASTELIQLYQSVFVFNTQVNTESNETLKVVNSILAKLRLNVLDKKYESGIAKLLRFRNSMAHGDEGMPILQKDIDFFTLIVGDASSDLIVSIVYGLENKVFAKVSD